MTDQPLSPAAQAVKDAAFHGVAHDTAHTLEARIAAALRAAVEQVLPLSPPERLPPAGDSPGGHFVHGWAQSQLNARVDLLNIVAELENHQ